MGTELFQALLPTLAYLVGLFVGAVLTTWYYRRAGRLRPKERCTCARTLIHPSEGRFCHICGADAFINEHCDAGLHS